MKLTKFVLALGVACCLAGSFAEPACFANPTNTSIKTRITDRDTAIAVAKAEMPADAVFLGYKAKKTPGKYEVTFRDPTTLDVFEVEVNNGKVTEVDIDSTNYPGSVTIKKTEADIQGIILSAYPDARDIVVTKKLEDNGYQTVYKAYFTTAKFKAEAKLNPATGAFGKRELKYF